MIVRKKGSIAMQVELDNLRAENERLKADMDYVAMMTDVEIGGDEAEGMDAEGGEWSENIEDNWTENTEGGAE